MTIHKSKSKGRAFLSEESDSSFGLGIGRYKMSNDGKVKHPSHLKGRLNVLIEKRRSDQGSPVEIDP